MCALIASTIAALKTRTSLPAQTSTLSALALTVTLGLALVGATAAQAQTAAPAIPAPAIPATPEASEPAKQPTPAPTAETTPIPAAANAAASVPTPPEPTAVPVSATTPDPLTPPKVEEGPAMAPSAPKPQEAARQPAPAEVDPIITAARRSLDAIAGQNSNREDRAALAAFYAGGDGSPVWVSSTGLTAKGKRLVAEMKRANDWGLDAAAFEVPPAPASGASPDVLADQEIRIGLAALKYARHARGGRADPQSISKLIDFQPRTYEPRSVIEALAASDEPDGYLKGLHPQHSGFQKLRKALVAARKGDVVVPDEQPEEKSQEKGRSKTGRAPAPARTHASADVIQRIVVNMERWRWMPDNMGKFYVWDNVPEQVTRVIHDGKAVLTEKIVVGKPNTQTPEFSAPMKFVIFHPSWGVPEGIKTNELAPLLRRASSNNGFFSGSDGASRALRRHELVVMQNGRQVNPDSVNWSSVDVRQFQFTQPPSAKNVLGVVKFRFPNRHDVYMHDTPERHLFGSSVRAFSHGCMRVQNPIHLAEVILAYDKGWSTEKVNAMSRGGNEVTLDKNVPVHITYFTAAVDYEGKLKLFGDIYGKDARVASALAGKPINLAAAVATADPGAPRETGPGGKREKRARVKKDEGFNPFGFLTN